MGSQLYSAQAELQNRSKDVLGKKYEMAMYFTTNFACISVSFAVYKQFWSVANQEKYLINKCFHY